MSKAYPSNLTRDQFELISGLIPTPKPSGRPRKVDILDILNRIFYVLCEGCRWRALPGVPTGRQFTPTSATGVLSGHG